MPPSSIVSSVDEEPSGVCHFLRLPLEIRDKIYRVLLTTPYCIQLSSTKTSLKFCLSTDILLANKQISTEATRVLWKENDFIILKLNGLNLSLKDVPVFKLLSEDSVEMPSDLPID
jgi:hypothetical protein